MKLRNVIICFLFIYGCTKKGNLESIQGTWILKEVRPFNMCYDSAGKASVNIEGQNLSEDSLIIVYENDSFFSFGSNKTLLFSGLIKYAPSQIELIRDNISAKYNYKLKEDTLELFDSINAIYMKQIRTNTFSRI